MEIRLLGPLEIVDGGQQVSIGGPRQQVVLAMLALNANRVTPNDQLVDAVWGELPPATARSQIQICISALRRVLADAGRADLIVTRPSGYLLATAAGELDIDRFARLGETARVHADHGRTAQAAEGFAEALGLWRGPALMGIPSDLAQRAATVLNEQRLAVTEEAYRLELELGRHDKIIGPLFELIAQEPLRERLYGSLMLALYRAGRQADALDVFRRMRAVLVSELGIEPGRELQELEMAILNGDPRLEAPTAAVVPSVPAQRSAEPVSDGDEPEVPPVEAAVPPPHQLPTDTADFTGRQEHVEEIRDYLQAPVQENSGSCPVRVVGITGKGGIGKSSLAVRVAHELHAAFPDGQLYADLHGSGGDGSGHVLGRFLRALGVASHSVPDDLEERKALYRSRLAGQRVLVVLDDVPDERLLRDLLPGSASCAVIVTSRSRLSGLPGIHRVNLDLFTEDLSVELLSRIAGHERVAKELPAAVELANFCAGLPLALRIAGARLACRPHWRINRLVQRLRSEAGRLDELAHGGLELRSNIALAYGALGPDAQRLFRLFALPRASDFAGWTAAALLDVDLPDAEDIVEELVDAQLLDVLTFPGEDAPRYRFHDLIKIYARERLAEADPAEHADAALRRVLAAWMSLAEECHRREYGGDYTVLHGTGERWRLPEDELADLLKNPMAWWETERRALVAAVNQAADLGLDELCWDLALTSVTLFETKGYFDDWRETSEAALRLAEATGNRRGRAAMRYSLGTLHMFQKRLAEADACFLPALDDFAEEGERHGWALVLRNMAFVDRLRGDHEAMMDKYTTVLADLRELGDKIGEAHVLCSVAKVRMDAGEYDTAREMLNSALAICRETGCLRVEAQVIYRLGELYLKSDTLELANQAFNWVLRLVRKSNDRIGESHALYGLGLVHWGEGRTGQAEAVFLQAVTLARQVGERTVEAQSLYSLGSIALGAGSLPAARTHLEAAAAIFDDLGSALWQGKTRFVLADVHGAGGDADAALAELAATQALLADVAAPEADRLKDELFGRRIMLRGELA
ncbi:BTAD domain-containing putative transcriptional regulator [Streptomyces sp. Y1]|uniref:BTAD domain-containing putative transcriptional regulator n=1 Tax=Streptomyces sp. Y1 TaxID=3238634 RepID=A0AB39TKJ8_9ACTN